MKNRIGRPAGVKNGQRIKTKCQQCGLIKETSSATRMFCSRKCCSTSKRVSLIKVCEQCGKDFEARLPCGNSLKTKRFCDGVCSRRWSANNRKIPKRTAEWNKKIGDAQKGEKGNNWKGGVWLSQPQHERKTIKYKKLPKIINIKGDKMIQEIFSVKKTKKTKEQIITLLIASLLMAIASMLLTLKTNLPMNILTTAIIVMSIYFIGSIIKAGLYAMMIKIIANKGTYKDSLTAITQSAIIFSAGALITALLIMLPRIGFLLGFVTMFLTIMLTFTIFIRAMTTLTKANTVQVLTAILIYFVGLIIASQTIITIQILSEPFTNAMNTVPTEDFAINMADMPQ